MLLFGRLAPDLSSNNQLDDQLVVYYYDKAAVESEDIDEAELDDDHEYVEWSTVDEVRQWIKDSGRSVV